MKTIVIDNKDSFTFNLVQYISEANDEEPLVLDNSIDWRELKKVPHDNLILSPGPGSPHTPSDVGVCTDVVAKSGKPILGVCLGHQCMVASYGGTVAKAPQPFHGRTSLINRIESPIFDGLPKEFLATRYHSLVIHEPLPDCLVPSAWTNEGLIMAIEHRYKKQYGVQFHPESISSQFGKEIVANFLQISCNQISQVQAGRDLVKAV